MRIVIAQHILDSGADSFLQGSVLPLGPPLRDLRQARRAEMVVEGLIAALVRREERSEILDSALSEHSRKMVDGLLREVRAEDDGEHSDRHVYTIPPENCRGQ